jgi:hypothetical protein
MVARYGVNVKQGYPPNPAPNKERLSIPAMHGRGFTGRLYKSVSKDGLLAVYGEKKG